MTMRKQMLADALILARHAQTFPEPTPTERGLLETIAALARVIVLMEGENE